ncbi:MAG: DUF4864 domain-containing protein [Pseudomonadales bacterium]|jgi:hypothetical protein|nr:DUF4864 domain-containing protein [Pseudomonadales bacterium]
MLARQSRITLGAACIALAGLVVAAAQVARHDRAVPKPAQALGPAEVVRLQLEALAHNDEPFPGAGVEATWAFASPANRAATGPIAHFRSMFEGRLYGPMIDHLAARYSAARLVGGRALVGVVLTATDGRERGYLFQLSRQDTAACGGCWMTDSVIPVPVGRARRSRVPVPAI